MEMATTVISAYWRVLRVDFTCCGQTGEEVG